MDALGGGDPFIMEVDGRSMPFAPSGLKDGPLPTHYEPVESPVRNSLYPGQQFNPGAKLWTRPGNELHAPEDPRLPYVLTTFRLTELHCGAVISRVAPHTAELQPEMFVELPPELAELLGIGHLGARRTVASPAQNLRSLKVGRGMTAASAVRRAGGVRVVGGPPASGRPMRPGQGFSCHSQLHSTSPATS